MRCAVRLIKHKFPKKALVTLPCARCGMPSAVRVLVKPLVYVCTECFESILFDQNGDSLDRNDGDK